MGQPNQLRLVTANLAEGTGGTETSHVPRGTESIPVVVASEPGVAQTDGVPSRQALHRRGWKTGQVVLPHGAGQQSCIRRRLESVAVDRDSRVATSSCWSRTCS